MLPRGSTRRCVDDASTAFNCRVIPSVWFGLSNVVTVLDEPPNARVRPVVVNAVDPAAYVRSLDEGGAARTDVQVIGVRRPERSGKDDGFLRHRHLVAQPVAGVGPPHGSRSFRVTIAACRSVSRSMPHEQAASPIVTTSDRQLRPPPMKRFSSTSNPCLARHVETDRRWTRPKVDASGAWKNAAISTRRLSLLKRMRSQLRFVRRAAHVPGLGVMSAALAEWPAIRWGDSSRGAVRFVPACADGQGEAARGC